jgi:hypothetical protein
MSARIRPLALPVALLAMLLIGLLSGAAPAAAAPAPSTPLAPKAAASGSHVTKFSTTLTKKDRTGAASRALAVITCGGTISTPVVQDVPGNPPVTTVNAFCDAPVDSIDVVAIMARNGVSEAVGTDRQLNATSATASASVLCLATKNNYQGFGSAAFVKAGYIGSPLFLSGSSPVVNGSC